ncbi:MAG TPA: outer membrane protein assembly factor BamD [Candidatus Babeliales bacterium]|nr:outer membrane protein assembly factor BamD [Candidatus Babeliales bacterium]
MNIYRFLTTLASLAIIALFSCSPVWAKKKEKTVQEQPSKSAQTDTAKLTDAKPESPKKNKRNKDKETEIAQAEPEKKKKHTLRDMTYEELKEAKGRYLANKDLNGASKFLEKMIPMCADLNELHDIMLELADLFYTLEDLEKAGKIYQEFTKLYPGSQKVEYAYFKAIECSFKQIGEIDRDQSKTKDTIELSEQFLEREAVFITYTANVKEILAKCRKQLLESEMNIFNFYLDRGMLRSAEKRLSNIRKDFLPFIPTIEPNILSIELSLAEQHKNKDLVDQKLAELTQKFPDFVAEQKKEAATSKSKRVMVNRF